MPTRAKARGFQVVALLCVLLSGFFSPARAQVTVTQAKATVERRTFDPRHPPKELPPLTPPEAGVCLSNFSCEANVGIEGPTEFVANRPTRVTLVNVRLRLAIVIWTIAAPPAKLRAHEEGHREIAESYYARAKDVAEKLAAGLIGRALAVPVDDSPAMKQAIGKLQEELLNGYQRQISLRSKVAQVQFDLITQHGANSVPESQAIARALAAEANSR